MAEAGDGEASLEALHKWIHAAEQSGDQGALAQAHMQMGLAYQQQVCTGASQLCSLLDAAQPCSWSLVTTSWQWLTAGYITLIVAAQHALCILTKYEQQQQVICLQGEHSEAVMSLQEYIQLCLHLDHIQAEAQAFCALADCQQLLGNLEGAVQSLQAFLLKSRHHDAQVMLK